MRTIKDIAWLGGLLEGEGWFGLTSNKRGVKWPIIGLSMTDKDTVVRASQLLGIKAIPCTYRWNSRPNEKPVYKCQITSTPAVSWMMTLYQFLGQRRKEKIKSLLEHWRRMGKTSHAPRGTRWFSQCEHPGRPIAANGLCHTCYMRRYREHNYQGVRSKT